MHCDLCILRWHVLTCGCELFVTFGAQNVIGEYFSYDYLAWFFVMVITADWK